MLEIICVLIVAAVAGAIIARSRRACESLQQEREALRRARDAWKNHAIALETVLECEEEVNQVSDNNPSSTRKEREAARSQLDNAEAAASETTCALYDTGEWPDAKESAIFRM